MSKKKIYYFDDSGYSRPKTKVMESAADKGYEIEFIKVRQVKETPTTQYSGKRENENLPASLIFHGYPPSALDPAYGGIVMASEREDDWFHPGGGIGDKEIKKINEVIKAGDNKAAALVFDWDQTLSLINRLDSRTPAEYKNLKELHSWYRNNGIISGRNFTEKELAKYFLHDPNNPKRIENLKAALQEAQANKIPIFILTHNTFAPPADNIDDGREQLLVDILDKALGIRIPLTHIVKGIQDDAQPIVDKIIPMLESVQGLVDGSVGTDSTVLQSVDDAYFAPERAAEWRVARGGRGKTKKRKSRKSKKVKKRKLRKTKKKHSAVMMNNKNTKKRNTKKRSPQYVKGIDNSELRKYGLGPNKWYYKN